MEIPTIFLPSDASAHKTPFEQEWESFLRFGAMMVPFLSAFFLWVLGDFIDVLVYILLMLIVYRFRRYGQKLLGPTTFSSHCVLWWAIHFTFFAQLNRVWGYPDNESTPMLAIFVWLNTLIAVLVIGIRRKITFRRVFVIAAIIFLPVIELPTFLLRQGVASLLVQETSVGEPEILYFSQIHMHQAIAVGRAPGSEGTCNFMAVVFKPSRTESILVYSLDLPLLIGGGGSMDDQTPNLPWLMSDVILPDLSTCFHRPAYISPQS